MGPLNPPPPRKKNSPCFGFFLYFEGKGTPKHKTFTGSRGPFRGGVSEGNFWQIFLCLCLFSGPEVCFPFPRVFHPPLFLSDKTDAHIECREGAALHTVQHQYLKTILTTPTPQLGADFWEGDATKHFFTMRLDSPPKDYCPYFFQKGVGGSRFRCLIVMRRIDIYTSACDCGLHLWNRCL